MAKKKQEQQLPDTTLELSNGHKVYFTDEMKGKHHLAMQRTVAKSMKSKPVISNDGKITDKTEVDLDKYQEELVNLFPHLVEKIEDEKGQEIEPSVEYYLNATFNDAKKLYSKVMELVASTRAGSVKKN